MSMADELAACFRAELTTLGHPIVWDAEGDRDSIYAVLDTSPDLSDQAPAGLASGFGYPQARWLKLFVHADDVAGRPEQDVDKLEWDGLTWTVRQVEPDQDGAAWALWCSADERGGFL